MEIISPVHRFGVALLRVAVGVIFLWAGLEKAVGEGLGAWSAAGFLQFGTIGTAGWPFVSGDVPEGAVFNPTHHFWASVGQDPTALSFINYLVPLGQIGIGVSLILGFFTRFGAAMGAVMMLVFFVAAWEFQFGIVNQHLTYALVCAAIAGLGAGKYWGFDGALAGRVPGWFRTLFMSGPPARIHGAIAW